MKANAVTNQTLWNTDWAATEKLAALRGMPKPLRSRHLDGNATKKFWMEDVSASDSRSVKAWLNGRGDGRVLLWKLKSVLGGLFRGKQHTNMEQAVPRVADQAGQWRWKLNWVVQPASAQVTSAN